VQQQSTLGFRRKTTTSGFKDLFSEKVDSLRDKYKDATSDSVFRLTATEIETVPEILQMDKSTVSQAVID